MALLFRNPLYFIFIFSVSCTGAGNSPDNQDNSKDKMENKISYWDTQPKGANQFNRFPSENWFKAAAKANIFLVRLTYDKWETEHRNFLKGNADNMLWEIFRSEFKNIGGNRRDGFPETYNENISGKLEYGFYSPAEIKKDRLYPLLIYLHGWGQNQAVYLDWYKEEIQSLHPCFVYTPRTPLEWGDWSGWGNELSEPMELAVHVMDSLIERYPIDTCSLYVYGISMGGEGTFDLLDKFPGRFAAAMSVCGGGKPEWAENISQTPFWMFHGSDDDVNPVNLTRDVYDALVSIGAYNMRYTEYKGYGHDIWNRAPQESDWYDWMFNYSRCAD